MEFNEHLGLFNDHSLAVQQVLNWSCFLVPEDIKDGSVVHAETTTTQVKISWTNPPSSGGVMMGGVMIFFRQTTECMRSGHFLQNY